MLKLAEFRCIVTGEGYVPYTKIQTTIAKAWIMHLIEGSSQRGFQRKLKVFYLTYSHI